MTKLSASIIHLTICVVIAVLLFLLFWLVWYPAPLFRAVGGLDIFLMMLGIDVILGPLLTFVVFKKEKKSLRFDLSVIALVQIAALIFGVYTLLIARPVYIAGLGHRFDVVHANDVTDEALKLGSATLPWTGPIVTGIKPPTDSKEREKVLFGSLAGNGDYGSLPQYHAPLISMKKELLERAQPISALKKLNPTEGAAIDQWLVRHGRAESTVVFQGLAARSMDMAVVLDATTAEMIGIAPFKPWE